MTLKILSLILSQTGFGQTSSEGKPSDHLKARESGSPLLWSERSLTHGCEGSSVKESELLTI